MQYSSRVFALILASVISFFTVGFLYMAGESSIIERIVVLGISFGISFVVIYFAFEFLIFKEINELHQVLDKLRKNEKIIRSRKLQQISNPIKKINQEIYDLALSKQLEIDELKRMEEYRREFLANVSHELKTPIFSAQGFIQTLLDGAMEDETVRQKFLKKSSKNLDSLNVLVQDLLTISQLESGEITMNKEFFDIRKMTAEIVDHLDVRIKKKGFSVTIDPGEDTTIEVFADTQRIGQVMTNLIENAIKYGKEGGSLLVSFVDRKKKVQIQIKDNGPGIDPEKLPRIFERFYRVDKHRSRETGGTGLGLSIVKHILDSHDSSIEAESKVGKGTTFTFSLTKQ